MEGQKVISDSLEFVQSIKEFRASDGPVSSSYYKLITAAHNHELIFVILNDKKIGAVINSEILNPPDISKLSCLSYTLDLSFTPTILSVAHNGFSSLLMVAGIDDTKNCPCIEFFDIDERKSIGRLDLSELSGSEIFDYAWHPRYFESLLSVCSRRGDLLVIAIQRKEKAVALVYRDQQYGVLTCCWSPKGKNLAIATLGGEILRLEPLITSTNFSFKEVDKSRMILSNNRISDKHKIIKLRWIKAMLLICVHAKLDNQENPDTVYSLFSIKQPEPHFYWSGLCSERATQDYNVQIVNLTNIVICLPTSSGEAAVLGVASEAKSNDPGDWSSFIIDEEGARIELPLDENNQETYSRGVTVAYMSKKDTEKPIIVVYTTSGSLVPYKAVHVSNGLKLTSLQPSLDFPMLLNFEREARTSLISVDLAVDLATQISDVRNKIEFNQMFLTLLDDINYLRKNFDEVQDIHKIHREAIEAIKLDIDSLDLGMLENLYLVEYIKARSKGSAIKKSIDPMTSKKVEALRHKSKMIAEKLRDLDVYVEVAWEDFVRRKNAQGNNKKRSLNSLDIIYKTLSTNQKILNVLKKKASLHTPLPEPPEPHIETVLAQRELDPSKMRAFREFLASRNVVPVRRPESVRHNLRGSDSINTSNARVKIFQNNF